MTGERGGEEGGGARQGDLRIRALASQEDFLRCVDLQKATWGEDFAEKVPTAILRVARDYGGVVAGAFAHEPDGGEGEMVGFVFGLTGLVDGRPVHWSDMLAVRDGWRRRGVGRALKAWQRDHLLALGVHEVRWSFDPLEAANARLNLVRLGAVGRWFVRDMYGVSNSKLHAGQGTDRLIVSWWIGPSPRSGVPGRDGATEGNSEHRLDEGRRGPLTPPGSPGSASPVVRVPIPPDFQALRRESPDRALAWRLEVRAALEGRLADGWEVRGVDESDPETGAAGPFLVLHPSAPTAGDP